MNLKNFITFEGGECSGKTSIIEAVKRVLDEKGIPITLDYEELR